RANNWGHAAFRKGELTRLVCGSDTRSDRAAVNRGLKVLAAMGRIAPVGQDGSTFFCVIINRDLVERQAGKGSRKDLCSEIGHMDIRETPYSPNAMAPKFTPSPYATAEPSHTTYATAGQPDAADDPWADAA